MNYSRLRPWVVPAFIFIALIIIAVTATLFHIRSEKHHEIEKSQQIANAISKNMSREIEYRLQALKVFSSTIHEPPTNKDFAEAAKFLRSEYSGFYSINYVSADGIIRKVFPYADNRAAEGQNLLIRNDVSNYLLDSKKDGQPRASHRILTYQGIYAVVLYVPLYDKNKKFFGWTNGVLYIDNCLIHYMQDKNLENIIARVRWHHPSETNVLEYKWNFPKKYHTSTYKIMNQTLSIDLAILDSPIDQERKHAFYMTIAVRVIFIVLIMVLVGMLTLSKAKLQKFNDELLLKNNLLSSLSHDLATPLTSLKILLEVATSKGELADSKSDIFNAIQSMDQMMKSVRVLHIQQSGDRPVPIGTVSLRSAVTEGLKLVDQLAKGKNIKFNVTHLKTDDLKVKADTHTLVHNVLLNVFTNAIKFSPPDSTVTVGINTTNGIALTVANPGYELTEEEIEQFKNFARIESRKGTQGEPGTGLGLMQIYGFMKMYDGDFVIERNHPGTKVTLRFKTA